MKMAVDSEKAQVDAQFPSANQTRHCYPEHLEYLKSV